MIFCSRVTTINNDTFTDISLASMHKTYTLADSGTDTHTQAHMCTRADGRLENTHTHTHTRINSHTHAHTCTHTRMQARTHTRTHVNTTHTHIYA